MSQITEKDIPESPISPVSSVNSDEYEVIEFVEEIDEPETQVDCDVNDEVIESEPYRHNCTVVLSDLLDNPKSSYSFDAPELKNITETYGKIDLRECIGSVKFEFASKNWARNATVELTLKTSNTSSVEDISVATENCGDLIDEVENLNINEVTDTNNDIVTELTQQDQVRKINTVRVLNFSVSKIANARVILNMGCACEWSVRTLNDSNFDMFFTYVPDFHKIIASIKNKEMKALSKYRFSQTVHKISVDTLNSEVIYYQNELKEKQLKISGLKTTKKSLEKNLRHVTNELNELLSFNTKLKQKYDSLSASNLILGSKLQTTKDKLVDSNLRKNYYLNETNAYKKQVKDLKTDLGVADELLKVLNNKVESLRKDKIDIYRELCNTQNELNCANNQNKGNVAEIKTLMDEQSHLLEKIDSLELQILELKSNEYEQNSLLNTKIKKIEELNAELSLTGIANRQFQKCVESQTKRIVELEKTIKDDSEKYTKLDNDIENLLAEKDNLDFDYQHLETVNMELKAKIDANNRDNFKDENDKLIKLVEDLKASLQKSRNEFEELDDEFEEIENELIESENKREERDDEIEKMKKQISELKEQNSELKKDSAYKTDFKNLYNKFTALKDNYSNNEKERFAAQERVNELTNDVVSLTSQIKEQEGTIKQLESDKQSYSDTLNSQKDLIENISTDMDNFKNSNVNLKKILEVKEKDITNLEDLITEYKAELDKPMKYRDEYNNLIKDKEYLSKQNDNISKKFNEVKTSFDKFVWDTQEKNKITAKKINQLKKCRVNPKIVMQDLEDFYNRMGDTYSYYQGRFKMDKDVMIFLNETKLLINDVLQYTEINFGKNNYSRTHINTPISI